MPRKSIAKERAIDLIASGGEEQVDGLGNRTRRALTNAEIAEAVGVRRQTLSTWWKQKGFRDAIQERIELNFIRYGPLLLHKAVQLGINKDDVQALRIALEVIGLLGQRAKLRIEARERSADTPGEIVISFQE